MQKIMVHMVGSDDLIETISKSKIEFDVLIATPDMMPKLGKVAKILRSKRINAKS